ncbi:hypothetical protein ARAM_001318 [Aspergillus rambellii]|uniref:C2H2 transcription factor n=1 Tax=Aspergillus rambellii TaxID=308745 RepID=A0A0F8VKF8_9EURO|nr:hypothetical protein ARAM_001318 [Aspergillus rambellii]
MSPENPDPGQEALDRHEADSRAKCDDVPYDREVEQPSTAVGQTKCSICQSTFRRPEHLKRHFRSHTKEKPFECAQCGRHFSRTDTLHRHELSHHTIGADGGKDRTHRITVKTFRACYKCAIARVRCSGGMPCSRCENRSLECQYPTERRSKAKLQKNGVSTLSVENDVSSGQSTRSFSTLSTNAPETSHKRSGENSASQSSGYQMGQFQLQLTEPNPSIPSEHRPLQASSQEHTQTQAGTTEGTIPEPTAALSQTSIIRVSDIVPQSFPSFSGQSHQLYSPLPNLRTPNSPYTDRRLTSGCSPECTPLDIVSSGSTISGIVVTDGQHEQMGFPQPFLDQSTVSTINWLSNDLFLGSPNDQGLVSAPPSYSLQPGAFDGSLNQTTWLPPVINTEHMGSSLSGNISQTPSGNTSLGDDMDNSANFVQGPDPRSQSRSESSKRPADWYADEPSRLLLEHRRNRPSWPVHAPEPLDIFLKFQSSDSKVGFSFPVSQEAKVDPASEPLKTWQIQPSTYDQIYNSFVRLCCTETVLYSKFETENFPTAGALSRFLNLYFRFFHPVYPIFHTPTFDPNKCHWLVTLALVAVGSHSQDLCERNGTVAAFHELLRRAIFVEKEKCPPERTPLWLLQAILLNCVGRLHGGSERGRISALGDFTDLTNLATRERLLCCPGKINNSPNEASVGQEWTLWVEEESRKRTGYLIWLVDSTIGYHFDNNPSFSLDDGQAPLPSDEHIWQAGSAQEWERLYEATSGREQISLYDAALTLYIEKRLVPEIGDFNHTLIIHALYHRMWEVGEYFRRPLSFWNPTAKKQSRRLAIPSGSVWLPGIPSYSKWRNSACDCLDILHWKASDLVAKANGHEHPTILHLHTARIVLLAPFREIRLLVTLLVTGKANWADRQQVIEWHYILRWINHDQYKARLAIIHAGLVLWHVRRFKTNAFHEPVATYLAILTLWAYGLSYSQAPPDITTHGDTSRESSGEAAIINLDQPCDDDLVQLFVRDGQNMRGILAGVGDLCSLHGTEQILRVGCETLAGLSSWGISKEFMVVLMKLVELVS